LESKNGGSIERTLDAQHLAQYPALHPRTAARKVETHDKNQKGYHSCEWYPFLESQNNFPEKATMITAW